MNIFYMYFFAYRNNLNINTLICNSNTNQLLHSLYKMANAFSIFLFRVEPVAARLESCPEECKGRYRKQHGLSLFFLNCTPKQAGDDERK